jgi:hypothetical protein
MAESSAFGRTSQKKRLSLRCGKASLFYRQALPKAELSAIQSFSDSKTLFSKRVLVGFGAKPQSVPSSGQSPKAFFIFSYKEP